MRSGELIALKWKNIFFDVLNKKTGKMSSYIYIDNAISERETLEDVRRREAKNNLAPKTRNGIRQIPMMDAYRELLEGYKDSYRGEFQTKDVDDMYVFPNINARKNYQPYSQEEIPFIFQKQKNLLKKIKDTCKILGLREFDVQMFRHGTAYFLCMYENASETACIDYMGHADEKMIREVYLNLTIEERRQKTENNFDKVIGSRTNQKYKEKYNSIQNHRYRVGEDLEKRRLNKTYNRRKSEIIRKFNKGANIYYVFSKKDIDMITDILSEKEVIDILKARPFKVLYEDEDLAKHIYENNI